MSTDNSSIQAELLASRPPNWPVSPSYFLEFTEDALVKQLAFYQGCYPGVAPEALTSRALSHITWLRQAIELVKSGKKPGSAPKPGEKYTQFLLGLDLDS